MMNHEIALSALVAVVVGTMLWLILRKHFSDAHAIVFVGLFTVIGTVYGWTFNARETRIQEERNRRMESYARLIKAAHGFRTDDLSAKKRAEFLLEWELGWLYCPDDVLRQGKAFAEAVRDGKKDGEEGSRQKLQELIKLIREDMLRRKAVTETRLTPSDFELFGATPDSLVH